MVGWQGYCCVRCQRRRSGSVRMGGVEDESVACHADICAEGTSGGLQYDQ